jgi:hypothetical protein
MSGGVWAGKLRVVIGTALVVHLFGCQVEVKNMVPEDYRSWEKTTDKVLNYPIPGHENHLRIPYINPTGEQPEIGYAGGVKTYSFPKGTIIVKEVYDSLSPDPGSPPTQLTVMVKKPDDPRSRGGWLWIVKDPATGKETVLQNEFCFTCHSNANEPHPYGDKNPKSEFRDYVFFVYEEAEGEGVKN